MLILPRYLPVTRSRSEEPGWGFTSIAYTCLEAPAAENGLLGFSLRGTRVAFRTWIGRKRLKHALIRYKLLIFFFPFPLTFKIIDSRVLGLFCFPVRLICGSWGNPVEGSRAVFLMPPPCWLKSLSFPSGRRDLEERLRSNKAPSVVRLPAGRDGGTSAGAELGHPGAPAAPPHGSALVRRDPGMNGG